MIDRSELKEIVRELLIEMIQSPSIGPDQWLDLADAWQLLGYPSYSALYKDVQSGLFRRGKEVCDRRKPGAKKAQYQINLAAARKRLQEDPAKRRGV